MLATPRPWLTTICSLNTIFVPCYSIQWPFFFWQRVFLISIDLVCGWIVSVQCTHVSRVGCQHISSICVFLFLQYSITIIPHSSHGCRLPHCGSLCGQTSRMNVICASLFGITHGLWWQVLVGCTGTSTYWTVATNQFVCAGGASLPLRHWQHSVFLVFLSEVPL